MRFADKVSALQLLGVCNRKYELRLSSDILFDIQTFYTALKQT